MFGVVAGLGLAGCPGVDRPIEHPRVELESVVVSSASMVGIDVQLAFAVSNPNDTAMTLQAVDWELSLGGAGPIRDRVWLSERIDARASSTVLVPARIDQYAAARLAPRLGAAPVRYDLRAVLHFQSSRGDRTAIVDQVGDAVVR